jgi:hypothetical protein
MTANHDLERRLADHFLAEAPPRAPDWVLISALAGIETTAQRRVVRRGMRNLPISARFTNLAVAAAVIIAIGSIGFAVLRSGSDQVGGPQASPSPSPSPTASPSTPPALSATFTSPLHGISVSYPGAWLVRPATEPWTRGVPQMDSAFADLICSFQGQRTDATICVESPANVFLALASQDLGNKTGDEWIASLTERPGDPTTAPCAPAEPITIDGVQGMVSVDCYDGQAAFVATGGRGYMVWAYGVDDVGWLRDVLASVRLHPNDAIDAAPSASS